MTERLVIDYDAWAAHADDWDEEAAQVRRRMSVDPDTVRAARGQFGRLGSSTIGAAYAEVLQERHALGERLGAAAEGIGARIRASLRTYRDTEADNTRLLGS